MLDLVFSEWRDIIAWTEKNLFRISKNWSMLIRSRISSCFDHWNLFADFSSTACLATLRRAAKGSAFGESEIPSPNHNDVLFSSLAKDCSPQVHAKWNQREVAFGGTGKLIPRVSNVVCGGRSCKSWPVSGFHSYQALCNFEFSKHVNSQLWTCCTSKTQRASCHGLFCDGRAGAARPSLPHSENMCFRICHQE